MDFALDEGQQLLQETARDFLDRWCPPGAVLNLVEDPAALTGEMWNEMSELGWMAIPFPEQYDGLGLGFLELAAVLEEMGRVVMPGPYFATVVLGGVTILLAGTDEQKARWLPPLATGRTKATVALYEPDGRLPDARLTTRAVSDGDGYILTGTKLFVLNGDAADLIVCPAADENGAVSLFVVETDRAGLRCRSLPTLDLTRPLAEVHLDAVRVPKSHLLGEPGQGLAVLARVQDLAALALGVELGGVAQRVLEMTVGYAKDRVQFGRPIGSFQAIKHKCADMHVNVVTAEAAYRYGAWVADQALKQQEAPLAYTASLVKSYVQEACYRTVCAALQVHGGIGFTWEYDLHLYLKRTKGVECMLGDSTYHRERVIWIGGEQQ